MPGGLDAATMQQILGGAGAKGAANVDGCPSSPAAEVGSHQRKQCDWPVYMYFV